VMVLLEDDPSANAQVRSFARAFVGDEAYAVAVLLYQLAVAREHPVSRFQRAAEIAVAPGPGATDSTAEGAATDVAGWADGQADAKTGQAFAADEIDEGRPVGHAAKVARYRRRGNARKK
jgi:hypothetical protein